MARLVGFIGNRPDLGARVIELEGATLTVRHKQDVTHGWGVGFYQGGEILLRRRPIEERAEIQVKDLTKDIRADILIAHVRLATVGAPRPENTHPFRYRQWLFAHTGTVESFSALRGRVAETLPEFLQRDVHGETDSELLFHLFLSFLHDAGQLARPSVANFAVCEALRSCVSVVDRLLSEEGHPPSAMNLLVTNNDTLFAVCAGAPAAYRKFAGQADLERLLGDGGLGRMRMPDYATSKLYLVASDFDDPGVPEGWTRLPERAIVTFTRADDPKIESL
jgi:glutamine amidotransferase